MERTTLPFTNGFYKSDSLPVSAQECINAYPQPQQQPALAAEILVGTPGIRERLTTGGPLDRNRGAEVVAGVAYVVNGDTLYQINDDFTFDDMGEIEDDGGRVSMAHNGSQLVILVPGGKGYVFDQDDDSLTEITDADFRANGNPLHVWWIDGYFVYTTDEDKIIVSELNQPLEYNALDFSSAESDPDSSVAPISYRNQLFIVGRQTIEGFQNIGGADFPFRRSGMFMDKGCYAPFSLVVAQNSFMFIGGGKNESAAVWAMSSGGLEKVSTGPVDMLIQSLSPLQLREIYSWTYSSQGSFFVGFVLPETTIVFDFLSGKWHERKSYIDSKLAGCRVSAIISAYNRLLCTDSLDGRIGEFDEEERTEYGSPLIRRFVTQPFQNNMKGVFFPTLEMTVESGVGNESQPDPTILMERSLDGKTWRAPRPRPMGKVGDYACRAIWRRNGRAARLEMFRFTVSDPVKFVAIQLTADISGGSK